MQEKLYIAVTVIVFIVYFVLFIRKHRAYQLILSVFAASTWLAYPLKGNKTGLLILGLVETGLLILLIFFLFKRQKLPLSEAEDGKSSEDNG